MPCFDCCIKGAGTLALSYAAYKLFTALYNIFYPYFIASSINLLKRAGANWAVVTGSTDGIGKAYAFELAKRGFNIFLVSRSTEKLQETKKAIEDKYSNVSVKYFAFDFTNSSAQSYATLLEALNETEIGVLVNNVGLSYEFPESLHNVEGGLERLGNITTINTLPPTLLSAGILPQMIQRHKGIIINISSSACYNQMSLWAVYSASKKYVQWLSAILKMEYASKGIIVQTVCPMLVATKMSKVKRTSFFTPSVDTFARSALNTVGHADETTGYFSHQLQVETLFSLPKWLLDILITHSSEATRKAALRKKEREAKRDN